MYKKHGGRLTWYSFDTASHRCAEGIMPQTKEHLAILRLLGIENFMVVLTKVDTVNDELKELILEDIKERLHTMRLDNIEIVLDRLKMKEEGNLDFLILKFMLNPKSEIT